MTATLKGRGTREDVAEFLAQKRIVIVGLSRNPKSYSHLILNHLRKRGYEACGVNRDGAEIENTPCFTNIASLPHSIEAALILLPPEASEAAARECLDAGAARIWVRGRDGSVCTSDSLAQDCADNGVTLIDGYCPLMFLDAPGFPHNLHAAVARWFNLGPAESAR